VDSSGRRELKESDAGGRVCLLQLLLRLLSWLSERTPPPRAGHHNFTFFVAPDWQRWTLNA